MADSESFLVTVPTDWNLNDYSTSKRKFPSMQDYVRELIRRDIEAYEKEHGAETSSNGNGKKK
ncbi:MAG: hypothetical protein Q8R15_04920 [Candidatus Micrarchaeota archaeon]|nr:hypothetical protein [Candidatus Micrarchaeota archaeon]